MSERVKGPASYFPSIEAKYGRPIAEWKALTRAAPAKKHMGPGRPQTIGIHHSPRWVQTDLE